MAKLSLKGSHLVTKMNTLNEMRTKEMNLQELRLFSVYLSKVNPKDVSTRIVKFPLSDFQAIMDLGRMNIAYFKRIAFSLVRKTISVPLEKGGFTVFNIFRMFKITRDDNDEWYIEIDVDDEILPLIFELKGKFFKYELWNALRLKGKNQLRMYEILKQYEKPGNRILSVDELKEMLGIEVTEYPQYKHFRQYVLEPCRKALAENTDISFSYETHSKKSRKIDKLNFKISKNTDYKESLQLDRFINLQSENLENISDIFIELKPEETISNPSPLNHPKYEERIKYLMSACDDLFNREEMIVIYSLMAQKVPHIHFDEHESYDYLRHKYREMEANESQLKRRGEKISNPYAYFKKMIDND